MENSMGDPSIIATIRNQDDPLQEVHILYMADENTFATSGIMRHFGVREILIPAYLVVKDLELMGTIVAAILEKISQAKESDSTFKYGTYLEAMGKQYTMTRKGEFMMLEEA